MGTGFAGGSHALALTVLTASEQGAQTAQAEFVRSLRESIEPGTRFEVVNVAAGGAGATESDEDRAMAGVRTRGLRATPAPAAAAAAPAPSPAAATTGAPASTPSPSPDAVTVAVGLSAARQAIERPGTEPLLLAMLSRLDFESLRTHPALRRTDRRVGVLLRDPSMADQLALVDAALPQKRRLGVIVTSESEPLLRELQRLTQSNQGWSLQVETAPDATALGAALRAVLPRVDALMVLPDLIGDNQAATLAVLRAAAAAGVPVFGASDGLVRSGGLAAAVSTPAQLAQQAYAMGNKLLAGSGGTLVVEAAAPAAVRVNANVARSLGLRLPSERELTERVTAIR
jgi:putative ABC transport system substrate-binding protein